MNANSNNIVTSVNTSSLVVPSGILTIEDLDEITNRLNKIAQRERQLLHDLTNAIEDIINKGDSSNSSGYMTRMPISSNSNQITCTICLDKPRDCVLEPCMHVCCCIACLQLITDNKCPVCRTPIDFYLKLYIC